PATKAVLQGTTIEGGSERFQTDPKGQFSFPPIDTNALLVVADEKGFSLAQSGDLLKSPTMIVRPWGRIEGRRVNCSQPVVGQRLKYRVFMRPLASESLQEAFAAGQ